VNLELPWNPVRLEQRIGRVDRIGQRRAVHAVNLIASHTPETDLLRRLADRLALAVATVGQSAETRMDPLASSEGRRLDAARAIGSRDMCRIDRPLMTTPRRRWRRRVRAGRIEVWELAAEDGDGHVIESKLVAIALEAGCGPGADAVAIASRPWRKAAELATESFGRVRLIREEAIAAGLPDNSPGLFQPGLFDRRHERSRLIAAAARAVALDDIEDRIRRVRRSQALTFRAPELRLVLAPRQS
jgi:hypothetical protein